MSVIESEGKSYVKYGLNQYAKLVCEYVQLVPPVFPDGGPDGPYVPECPRIITEGTNNIIPYDYLSAIYVFEIGRETLLLLDSDYTYTWDHHPSGEYILIEANIVDRIDHRPVAGDGNIQFKIPWDKLLGGDVVLTFKWERHTPNVSRHTRGLSIWENWNKEIWLSIAEKLAPTLIHSDKDVSECSSVEDWFFKNVNLQLDIDGNKIDISHIDDLQEVYSGRRIISTTRDDYKVIDDDTTHDIRLDFDVERYKKGDWNTRTCHLHIKTYFDSEFVDFQYWFFWGYNGTKASHPCDWEHITVRIWDADLINISNNIDNIENLIQGVYFSQHSGGEYLHVKYTNNFNFSDQPPYYFTDISALEWDGNHFRAYCAEESHAFYRSVDTNWTRHGTGAKEYLKGLGQNTPIIKSIFTDKTVIPKNKKYIWNIDISQIELIAHSHIGYANLPGFVKWAPKNWPWFIGHWGGKDGPSGPGTKEAWYSHWDSNEK